MSDIREAMEAARSFLEREEDGNAADFVTLGQLKMIARSLLSLSEGRDAVLEEAAKIVDVACGSDVLRCCNTIAAAGMIRSLKST